MPGSDLTCVLCAFHDDNREEPAFFIVDGTSVCEDHGIWIMRHSSPISSASGGPANTPWYSQIFNREIDDLDRWKESEGDGYA